MRINVNALHESQEGYVEWIGEAHSVDVDADGNLVLYNEAGNESGRFDKGYWRAVQVVVEDDDAT